MTPVPLVNCHQPFSLRREESVIRNAEIGDLPDIVSIHQKAFDNFFLTRLGRSFLLRYYQLVLDYSQGIFLVSEGRSGLEGFACGFVHPERFYLLMSHNKWFFALPILSAVVRHPSLVAQILRGVQRVEKEASHQVARSCELSSIAVIPQMSGKGVGRALVNAFLKQAWSLGAQHLHLDTEAGENEPANSFYRKAGFQHSRRFEKYKGRWMNEYVIHRTLASERL
jgi:ribosomal protein S18 acetylase RimI-like enzyme